MSKHDYIFNEFLKDAKAGRLDYSEITHPSIKSILSENEINQLIKIDSEN